MKNSIFFPVWSLFSISLAMASLAHAGLNDPSLLTIRDNEDFARSLCGQSFGKCDEVRSPTREFDNGNTFVRFEDSVAGKRVVLALPNQLSGDQLMEALIKVRTAHSGNARSITILTQGGLGAVKIQNLNVKVELLEKWFATAGANFHRDVRLSRRTALKLPAIRRLSLTRNAITAASVDTGTHPTLAKELAAKLGLPVTQGDLAQAGRTVYVVEPAITPVNLTLLQTLTRLDELQRARRRAILVTPYLPYARSDKQDQAGVTVTGRLVAELIEVSGAQGAVFARAHAPQSQGFFRIPTLQVSGRRTINSYLERAGVQMIISPDAGFQKDATLYADELNIPVGVVNKQRNLQTGAAELKGISGPSVKGLVVAITDDETASGGTLDKVGALLKSLGATRVYGVVTHLAGTGQGALKNGSVDELVVTNTFPIDQAVLDHPLIRALSIADEIADELREWDPAITACAKALAG